MARKSARTGREALEEALRDLREFHRLGRDVRRRRRQARNELRRDRRGEYGTGFVGAAAAAAGKNPDTLRKALAFADPERGYSQKELDELCRQCRRAWAGLGDEGRRHWRPFGVTHLIRLLSVPSASGQRAALEQEAIAKGWSTAELEAAIRRRYGARRAGGRRRRVPADSEGLLAQLEAMCESWRRWHAQAGRRAEADRGRKAPLERLPEALRRQVGDVSRRLARLGQAVAGELGRLRTGRGDRGAASDTKPRQAALGPATARAPAPKRKAVPGGQPGSKRRGS